MAFGRVFPLPRFDDLHLYIMWRPGVFGVWHMSATSEKGHYVAGVLRAKRVVRRTIEIAAERLLVVL